MTAVMPTPGEHLPGVPDRLVAALHELASTGRLLVALDFDGTLAPEVDDPAHARALPEAREAVLRLLALPGTRVALVSGRALGSLEEVAQLPEVAGVVLLAGDVVKTLAVVQALGEVSAPLWVLTRGAVSVGAATVSPTLA